MSALKKLNQATQERVLEEEKNHASSNDKSVAEKAVLQNEISELEAKLEALEASLGKGSE